LTSFSLLTILSCLLVTKYLGIKKIIVSSLTET
jgi:hypothetical protein